MRVERTTFGSEDNWQLVLDFAKQLVIMLRIESSQTNVASEISSRKCCDHIENVQRCASFATISL